MIDSAELKRLMTQVEQGGCSLALARAIYTAGTKRMQERAAAECDPTYTVLDVKRYILKLEIE